MTSDVIFTTERLLVRQYSDDDAPFVLDMYSRWEVVQFLGSAPRLVKNIDDAAAAIVRRRAVGQTNPLLGSWAVTLKTGEPIGTVVIQRAPLSAPEQPLPLSDDLELGWHLHPDHWGHGYATEAARGALKRTFDAGVDEVIALVHSLNEPSKRVANRLGMTHVGLTERYYGGPAELFRATRDQARRRGDG